MFRNDGQPPVVHATRPMPKIAYISYKLNDFLTRRISIRGLRASIRPVLDNNECSSKNSKDSPSSTYRIHSLTTGRGHRKALLYAYLQRMRNWQPN